MKIALSTIGKFHTFDLARELEARQSFTTIFTGYPSFKLKNEKLPPEKIVSFPWFHTPYMAFSQRERLGKTLLRTWERLDRITLDRFVARHMPACDVFVGLSSSTLESGRKAKALGAKFVCDRGSTHIRVQDQLLREEHERWGMPFDGVDPWVIEREEREYAEADCITVPSSFNIRSFLSQGIPQAKLRRLPYGVNLSTFNPAGEPNPERFDILFAGAMSLRKGIPYLVQAYKRLQHPKKSLTFAGSPSVLLIRELKARGLWSDDIIVKGHLTQPELRATMSTSHVMALPSIEEGLALVQAQAMACGCPVIGTECTGAEDLYTDGQAGFILPARRSDLLAEKFQQLADTPELRAQMSQAALKRVSSAGGWHEYGEQALNIYKELIA